MNARERIHKMVDEAPPLGAKAPHIERGESAAELLRRDFADPRHLCDPWIPEGLNITVARPKLGKSTLARQKMYAVASAGEIFGSECEQAEVLFLSLEEGPRQQRRKLAIFDNEAALGRIRIFYDWPRGAEGVAKLRAYLEEYPEVRFVTIDSLTRFRDVPDARTQAFSADYEAVAALQSVAKDVPGLAIELIHHTRKMRTDDPLDAISGTYGVSAAVDSYAVLIPAEGGATMHCGGRWWERDESEYCLVRENGKWTLTGNPDGLTRSQRETMRQIINMGTASPMRLATAQKITRQSALEKLQGLQRVGALINDRGVYAPTK